MSPFRQSQISETASARGYMKPASAFHPIAEWEELVLELLALQGVGIDSHGGELSCKHAMEMCTLHFGMNISPLRSACSAWRD